MKIRRAIILAAGRGSRMQELTDDKPKCLLTAKGRPLIEWQLGSLRASGIDEIAVVTGYRAELLEALALPTFHNPRWAQTNMVSSLACAMPWLIESPCLVSYSDIFYADQPVRALCDAPPHPLVVAYDPNWLMVWRKRFADPLEDAETFRIDERGRVSEIGRHPSTIEEVQGQYMGLMRFTPEAWAAVESLRGRLEPTRRDQIDMTSTLQLLIEQGFPVHGVPATTSWGELDSLGDFKQLD